MSGSIKQRIGYRTYNFGIWKHVVDNDADMLECPSCGCRVRWEPYEAAIGSKGLRFCPYCGKDMWTNDAAKMIRWLPNVPLFTPGIGVHLVTVKVYDSSVKKVIGVSTNAAHYMNDTWLGFDDNDIVAWAEMPEPYKGGDA